MRLNKMKKLFITGGNGFLGTHVLNELNNINYIAPLSSELDILDYDKLFNYLTMNLLN